jgi:hypothetical protein
MAVCGSLCPMTKQEDAVATTRECVLTELACLLLCGGGGGVLCFRMPAQQISHFGVCVRYRGGMLAAMVVGDRDSLSGVHVYYCLDEGG